MSLNLPRSNYQKGALDKSALNTDPFAVLIEWLEEAVAAKVTEPSAMCLATAGADGRPHGRMVLLRGLDSVGLTFFSHSNGPKGRELAENPFAAVTFWWGELERQVRVEGRVHLVDEEESDRYFASRPRESQLASAASPQSEPVSSREELESMVADLAAVNPEHVLRPFTWGGFRLVPDSFEFWQGRPARLHDRFVYRLAGENWQITRLAP